jgi:hypothetical protein
MRKQNVDQPGLDLEVAQALRKAAGLCVDLDRLAEARGHADEAIAAFRRQSAARGRDLEIEIWLADAWNTRAVVHSRSTREGARMLMAFRESARAAAACADREDDIEASALLAVVWTNLAVGEASAGHGDDASKAASSARDYAEGVIRRTPATTSPAVRAARTIPLLEVELFSAELEWKLGHFTEAPVQILRVIERMGPLAVAPRQGRPAARPAFTLRQYGELLTESGAADPLLTVILPISGLV